MGVSENRGTPNSSLLMGLFHYKPSILGYHYFWKHPNVVFIIFSSISQRIVFSIRLCKACFVPSRNSKQNSRTPPKNFRQGPKGNPGLGKIWENSETLDEWCYVVFPQLLINKLEWQIGIREWDVFVWTVFFGGLVFDVYLGADLAVFSLDISSSFFLLLQRTV